MRGRLAIGAVAAFVALAMAGTAPAQTATPPPSAAPEAAPAPGPDTDQPAPGGAETSLPGPSPRIQCYGDGQDGTRVQLIWARTSTQPPLSPTRRAQMIQAAADIDATFDLSADRAVPGAHRFVRWVTDSHCRPEILDLVVPANAAQATYGQTDFQNLNAALAAQGHVHNDRKYLVWLDTPNTGCIGFGTLLDDDRPAPSNLNNTQVGYTRIEAECLGLNANRAAAHELMHTFGAVQSSAPHATTNGHCSEEWDRMCYDDDANAATFPLTYACGDAPPTGSIFNQPDENLFDCHHDDYFHPSPPGSAYLDNHWNTADSAWLEPAPGPPPPNDGFLDAIAIADPTGQVDATNVNATEQPDEPDHAGDPGGASIWYAWTAPASGRVAFTTDGSEIDTLLGVYTIPPGPTGGLDTVVANDDGPAAGGSSEVSFDAVAGTTYYVAVDGKGGAMGPTRLRWFVDNRPAVELDVDKTTVAPGEVLSYQIDVTNGPDALDNVVLHVPPSDTCSPAFPTSLSPDQQVSVDCVHQVTGAEYETTLATQAKVESDEAPDSLSPKVTTPVELPPHGFTDVAPALDEAVRYVAWFGIATGFSDNTYRPTILVNRGQIVNMLWHTDDEPAPFAAHGFSDVPASAAYSDALDWAKAQHLVSGFPGNLYKPKDPVNRAQFVSMLWRMAGSPVVTTPHGYTDATATWYRTALRWAKKKGLLVQLAPGTTFLPKQSVSRGEVASTLLLLAESPGAWSAAAPPSTVLF